MCLFLDWARKLEMTTTETAHRRTWAASTSGLTVLNAAPCGEQILPSPTTNFSIGMIKNLYHFNSCIHRKYEKRAQRSCRRLLLREETSLLNPSQPGDGRKNSHVFMILLDILCVTILAPSPGLSLKDETPVRDGQPATQLVTAPFCQC